MIPVLLAAALRAACRCRSRRHLQSARRRRRAGRRRGIVNDATGLRDTAIARRRRHRTAPRCRHAQPDRSPPRGPLGTHHPTSATPTCWARSCASLRVVVARAEAAGVAQAQYVVDPGIGFGKTHEQNLDQLRRLGELRVLGRRSSPAPPASPSSASSSACPPTSASRAPPPPSPSASATAPTSSASTTCAAWPSSPACPTRSPIEQVHPWVRSVGDMVMVGPPVRPQRGWARPRGGRRRPTPCRSPPSTAHRRTP